MTKCEVVGIEDVSFTNKESGELVRGRKIHATYDLPVKEGVEGIGAIQAFLFTEEAFRVEMGDIVLFLNGKKGKVNDILILEKK